MKSVSVWIRDLEILAPAAETALVAVLRNAGMAISEGNPDLAIRELDRAKRTMPDHAALLLPVLGHLLRWHGRDPAAAESVLLSASRYALSAQIEADLVHCDLLLGRLDAARRRLGGALLSYAGTPEGPLAMAARELMRFSSAVQGFALLTPQLKLYVQGRDHHGGRFDLRTAQGEVLARSEVRGGSSGDASTWLPLPDLKQPQLLIASINAQVLLGGERIFPLDFRIDGRSTARLSHVEGWLHMAWNPTAPLEVLVKDETGRSQRIMADRRGPGSRWYFRFVADRLGLGHHLSLEAVLPDRTLVELPDSPLLLKPELDAQLRRITPKRGRSLVSQRPAPRPVDVIIPVFQGQAETLACITAVRHTTAGQAASIIVVDDASPDIALAADLDRLVEQSAIRLLRNPVNAGFAASVNYAMSINDGHDAVLLNSDTLVFGDWLQRLQQAAYSAPEIGSATPFSDDDSVVAYESGTAADARVALAEQLDHFAALNYGQERVELPVGVGFCMYLRRDCWRDIGLFDAAVFSKGYGEESDWCMRASKRGWRHVLAADVFVHHAGGVSFGPRRQALQHRAQRLLNLRYPGYAQRVDEFLAPDPLHGYRRGFDVYRLCTQQKPIVLILMLALTGGVDRFVGERCERLRNEGKLPLLLRPAEFGPEICHFWCADPHVTELRFALPVEQEAVLGLLQALPIESVELHHFLGLDSKLVEAVLDLQRPYDVYLHDYSWICPRITLMDETGRYCGEPDQRRCESCVRRNGSHLTETIGVAALRRRSQRWLEAARRIVVPCSDTARRYARYFPDLNIDVEPLEAVAVVNAPMFRHHPGLLRVALIGAIGEHKGYQVLLDCALDAAARGLDLEFVVIGHSGDDTRLRETGKVFVTGEYEEGEVADLIAREQPDLIWFPSVWPETWCYTLTYALSFGLPIVAFDIGAVAERLQEWGVGELLELDLSATEINDRLLGSVLADKKLEAAIFN